MKRIEKVFTMRLRVHVKFVGRDRVQVTKFSGQKTLNIKDFEGNKKAFDFDSFDFVRNDTKSTGFCLCNTSGDGTISDPYELIIYRKNYDIDQFERMGDKLDPKTNREATVESTIMIIK